MLDTVEEKPHYRGVSSLSLVYQGLHAAQYILVTQLSSLNLKAGWMFSAGWQVWAHSWLLGWTLITVNNICNNMDGSWGHYANLKKKKKKPDKGKHWMLSLICGILKNNQTHRKRK